MENYEVQLIGQEKFELGESPFYDPRFDRYSWVDIIRGEIWTMNEDGERFCLEFGQPVGAAVPVSAKEGLLLAAKDGLYYLDDGTVTLVKDLSEYFKPYLRTNDAKADPMGRVFFGSSLAEDGRQPEGSLYRFSETGIEIVEAHTKIANGMAWSGDHTKFFFADSEEHAVFVYDYDEQSGAVSNRRVLFTIEDGVPDGMCIDAKDHLYVAVWGGSRIEKRDGTIGEKLGEIAVPAKQVTSCCFAGEDLKTLFITTAGVGQSGKYDGCLFTCRVDEEGRGPDFARL